MRGVDFHDGPRRPYKEMLLAVAGRLGVSADVLRQALDDQGLQMVTKGDPGPVLLLGPRPPAVIEAVPEFDFPAAPASAR